MMRISTINFGLCHYFLLAGVVTLVVYLYDGDYSSIAGMAMPPTIAGTLAIAQRLRSDQNGVNNLVTKSTTVATMMVATLLFGLVVHYFLQPLENFYTEISKATLLTMIFVLMFFDFTWYNRRQS